MVMFKFMHIYIYVYTYTTYVCIMKLAKLMIQQSLQQNSAIFS